LGRVSLTDKRFTGQFSVLNCSTHLPLQFAVLPHPTLELSSLRSCLQGTEPSSLHPLPVSQETIFFSITPRDVGLHEERITIVNETCSEQREDITIRLFIDSMAVYLDLPQNKSTCGYQLDMGNIYLKAETYNSGNKGEEGTRIFTSLHTPKSFNLYNALDNDMTLRPHTDMEAATIDPPLDVAEELSVFESPTLKLPPLWRNTNESGESNSSVTIEEGM
jgi:hypothetical protein